MENFVVDSGLNYPIYFSDVFSSEEIIHLCENKFENVYLTFEYIPKVYESESDVVIEDAKLIYKKEFNSQYELTASTYTTSTPQQEVCISHILVPAPL